MTNIAKSKMPLILRPATLYDAKVLLEWRNDAATRQASHITSLIGLDEHIQWLSKVLSNTDRQLYIAEIAGIAVGTVRVDAEREGCELSWTVAPEARGAGIGKVMLRQIAESIRDSIRAEIKVGNAASIRLAEAAGMAFEREESGVLYYRRASIFDEADGRQK